MKLQTNLEACVLNSGAGKGENEPPNRFSTQQMSFHKNTLVRQLSSKHKYNIYVFQT